MQISVFKSIASGNIDVPSSKSYAHRFLLCAALSNEKVIINNLDLSNDIKATLSCLNTLGKKYTYDNKIIKIETIKKFDELDEELIFNCDESASTLRFIIPIALLTNRKLIFNCSKNLISRGIDSYFEIFKKQDIKYNIFENKIIIEGVLKPGVFVLSSLKSSQFVSGLLFALPLLKKDSKIIINDNLVSENYVEITINVLKKFGINIKRDNNEFVVFSNQKYSCNECIIEGDYSSASFLEAFNHFGGNVTLNGLNKDSIQGDKVFYDLFSNLKEGFKTIDINNCIDLGPILFVVASKYNGARFINTSRLKEKESDRVNSMCLELKKFNVNINEYENEVIINKSSLISPIKIIDSHNDHRIAMSLIVLLSYYGGTIKGVECIDKSYPNFLNDIKKLGIEYKVINEGSE